MSHYQHLQLVLLEFWLQGLWLIVHGHSLFRSSFRIFTLASWATFGNSFPSAFLPIDAEMFLDTIEKKSQWIKPVIWRPFPQLFLSGIMGEKGESFDTFLLFYFFNLSLSRLEKHPVFRFPDGPSSMIIYCVDMRRLVSNKQRSTNFQRNSNHLLKN